jgi:hypothetical protein
VGAKDEDCKMALNKKHVWTTFESRDKHGNHFKWSACKNCGKRP